MSAWKEFRIDKERSFSILHWKEFLQEHQNIASFKEDLWCSRSSMEAKEFVCHLFLLQSFFAWSFGGIFLDDG